ncbi:hypothetical protein AB0M43_38280 [Longispora sp. NPDC051575]|uniref:hypothetical protein n=1 Tax=Longispora sp. NPDC051575 TaxID=3154943 RepID=UPI003431735F
MTRAGDEEALRGAGYVQLHYSPDDRVWALSAGWADQVEPRLLSAIGDPAAVAAAQEWASAQMRARRGWPGEWDEEPEDQGDELRPPSYEWRLPDVDCPACGGEPPAAGCSRCVNVGRVTPGEAEPGRLSFADQDPF